MVQNLQHNLRWLGTITILWVAQSHPVGRLMTSYHLVLSLPQDRFLVPLSSSYLSTLLGENTQAGAASSLLILESPLIFPSGQYKNTPSVLVIEEDHFPVVSP